MRRFEEEDLTGAEFRECDLSRARLVGVVMQDAEIDGLVTNLVVNGVDVMPYVEAELDRRHPVRLLIRSDEPADLRAAWRQLRDAWAATAERVRSMPAGSEHRGVDGEWSMVETLRHLVFVHDSWFRRCVLGRTEPFTAMGLGPPEPAGQELDRSARPSLAEVLAVRDRQATEIEAWLAEVTPEQLARTAPVPEDDRWPPYARGRRVRQCLGTVLTEEREHHGFCVRDLDKLAARDAAGPVVRVAGPDDVGAVRRFGEEHVRAHYAPLIGAAAADAQVRDWWTETRLGAAAAGGLLVVAEQDGQVVGVGQRGRRGDDHVVHKLYLHPRCRGRGLGRRLLEALTRQLPADADRLHIEHFAANERAGAFYEREGFTVQRVEPSPTGDPALAVVWRARPLGRPD